MAGMSSPLQRFLIMKTSDNSPKIYVGTYGMYNNGSLFGKWFDLSTYEDRKAFYQDCYEYHRNELDPELMFQDWENIPDFLISECSLDQKAFDFFQAIEEMDDDTAEAFEVYCSQIDYWPSNGKDITEQLDDFQASYQGYFGGTSGDATVEYAYQYVEDTGMLSNVPSNLERYFDYEAFARDLFMDGYSEYDGHVFIDY